MPYHIYGRAPKMMRTLLTGGHMRRAYEQGPAKLAIIAITIIILAAGSMLALVSPSHAAPLPLVLGERTGGGKAVGSTPGTVAQSTGSSRDDEKGRPLAEMLNPDGTMNLRTGFSGSLDMA